MAERIVIRTKPASAPEPPADLALTESQVESLARELGEPSWWTDAREAARRAFRGLPVPSASDARFRRANPEGLRLGALELGGLAVSGRAKKPSAARRNVFAAGECAGQYIFEPAGASVSLSEHAQAAGVVLAPLWQAAREHPDLVRRYVGSLIDTASGKLEALAGAVADMGFFLFVPKGVRIQEPFHALLWTDSERLRAWRTIVALEQGAQAALWTEYASPAGDESAARIGFSEVYLEEGADLRALENQDWGSNVWSYHRNKIRVGRGGSLEWFSAQTGSLSGKAVLEADLSGEGARAALNGIYGTSGRQQMDVETYQNHLAPRTSSDLFFKGALWGESRAAWSGMIYIAEGAQGADGYQINRNLLLSESARADSLPGLEILADDVRCTHGATAGQLDENELYYAQARGIPPEDAREMLVSGFFEPVLDRVPFDAARKRIRLALQEKSGKMEEHTGREGR